jgi:hypothetical protein
MIWTSCSVTLKEKKPQFSKKEKVIETPERNPGGRHKCDGPWFLSLPKEKIKIDLNTCSAGPRREKSRTVRLCLHAENVGSCFGYSVSGKTADQCHLEYSLVIWRG